MQNNYLQSFGSYQQYQQNTPYFQNHPGASNSISNFNATNQYTGNQYDRFPPSSSNNNQIASTKIATNQNSELSEIKNKMKLLLQREISRDQNSAGDSPSPTCNICNKKGHVAKNCFTTKTCFKCNTKGHIAKFCKNGPIVQTCCEQTFEKTNIILETVNINNVSRILIDTRIAEQNVVMLYDPGSEYSIISRSMCEKLSVKPPLVPVTDVE